ncbi:MAG: hypothetical protein KY453_02665 [Gemmatimonadetes bacterium]|nr:hypothetical protein [Gemmatimonadota bacterium]
MSSDTGPGVPEALPRTLQRVQRRLGAERVDRLWLFPPIVKGRRERGLVAVSAFLEGDEAGRRRLFTAPYTAERTGQGLTLETGFEEEGDAPPETLPRVMDGVVRRSADVAPGEPREIAVGGDPDRFRELMEEFDPELLEPDTETSSTDETTTTPAETTRP